MADARPCHENEGSENSIGVTVNIHVLLAGTRVITPSLSSTSICKVWGPTGNGPPLYVQVPFMVS